MSGGGAFAGGVAAAVVDAPCGGCRRPRDSPVVARGLCVVVPAGRSKARFRDGGSPGAGRGVGWPLLSLLDNVRYVK